MKDPSGHGSNSKLTAKQGPSSPMPHGPSGHGAKMLGSTIKGGGGGGTPVSSNAQAAQVLMSRLKSTQAPVHPAMDHRSSPDGGSAS
jgi:hypothetical protein